MQDFFDGRSCNPDRAHQALQVTDICHIVLLILAEIPLNLFSDAESPMTVLAWIQGWPAEVVGVGHALERWLNILGRTI